MIDGNTRDTVPLRIEKPIGSRFRVRLQVRALTFRFFKLFFEECFIETIRVIQGKYPTDAFVLFSQIGFCDEFLAGIDQLDQFPFIEAELVWEIFHLEQGIACLNFFLAYLCNRNFFHNLLPL